MHSDYGLRPKVKADNINHDLLSMAAGSQETTHTDGDDCLVTTGVDAAEDVSVWVLCQVNNAIGRAVSHMPSV